MEFPQGRKETAMRLIRTIMLAGILFPADRLFGADDGVWHSAGTSWKASANLPWDGSPSVHEWLPWWLHSQSHWKIVPSPAPKQAFEAAEKKPAAPDAPAQWKNGAAPEIQKGMSKPPRAAEIE